ncbi:MAG: hypothetical protein WAV90_00435 [Gordonia amarae]
MRAIYDTRPFIDLVPRVPGFHDVASWTLWVPVDGTAVSSGGCYLDADAPDGLIPLGCGIEEMCSDLGAEWVFDRGDDYMTRVCALIDRQLVWEPSASLHCPEGRFLILLAEWKDRT